MSSFEVRPLPRPVPKSTPPWYHTVPPQTLLFSRSHARYCHCSCSLRLSFPFAPRGLSSRAMPSQMPIPHSALSTPNSLFLIFCISPARSDYPLLLLLLLLLIVLLLLLVVLVLCVMYFYYVVHTFHGTFSPTPARSNTLVKNII